MAVAAYKSVAGQNSSEPQGMLCSHCCFRAPQLFSRLGKRGTVNCETARGPCGENSRNIEKLCPNSSRHDNLNRGVRTNARGPSCSL